MSAGKPLYQLFLGTLNRPYDLATPRHNQPGRRVIRIGVADSMFIFAVGPHKNQSCRVPLQGSIRLRNIRRHSVGGYINSIDGNGR